VIGAAADAAPRWAPLAVGLILVTGVCNAAPPPSPPRGAPGPTRVHVVRKGETLAGIAARYQVSVGVLVAANRLRSAHVRLRPGQRLTIPRVRALRARRTTPPAGPPRVPLKLVLSIPDFDGRLPPFQWPVEGTVISTFGRRRGGWHRGLDIKAEMGMPVVAAASGVVTVSGVERRYGNVVKIQHDNDFVTVYAHHLQNFVRPGDEVDAGQVIGQVGRTGRATAYHLHFEILFNGSAYNPLYLLPLPPRLTEIADTEEEPNDDE
jgi:murein DD-endopeptidase MepM/ murein hydrolase activator NlpD